LSARASEAGRDAAGCEGSGGVQAGGARGWSNGGQRHHSAGV